MPLKLKEIDTDLLIIGGGTAGCYAALTAAEAPGIRVLIVDQAPIIRSGCLAAGVNALNAYIVEGQTPESYLDYVINDSEGLVREDLVLSLARRLNAVTEKIEALGLVIQKNESGNYASRGNRNIRINGENIKPILAKAVEAHPRIQVQTPLIISDYCLEEGRVAGACGFNPDTGEFTVIRAGAVICATGGASGLYRPNSSGFSRHKMWYSPFNTGAGYAMGIRAGAEMTTFEMRFIALRCRDTLAPTGTIAQGVGASQINGAGIRYEEQYGPNLTHLRVYATQEENRKGRGPCALETRGISKADETELYKAYLNMAPAQTLRWIDRGHGPSEENVEIVGSEPYVVGGHAGSGYWVDTARATTLKGLYAAGDVAGGAPQKYVTGCFAEGEIAARSVLAWLDTHRSLKPVSPQTVQLHYRQACQWLGTNEQTSSPDELEEAMQAVMDKYAGGIATDYHYNGAQLQIAKARIDDLLEMMEASKVTNLNALQKLLSVRDRLWVCRVLIRHLEARKETRWHSFQENDDFPEKDDAHWLKYVNSRYTGSEIEILFRERVGREAVYEHPNL